MTQSSCKCDTKSKSHPSVKLVLVRVFSCKHPRRSQNAKIRIFSPRAAAIVLCVNTFWCVARSLIGFELFLRPQLFNRTFSRNSKERFNWGFFFVWSRLSVRFKAAGKFYLERCRVSCYLFLPEYVFDDFFFLCSIKKVQLKMLDLYFFCETQQVS